MRKLVRILIALIIVLMSTGAYADRGGGGRHGGHGGGHRHGGAQFGIFVNPGWWGPGSWGPYRYPYYPYYPYYQPPVIVQPPPVITQPYEDESPADEQQQYWYFCPDPQGYYPHVKQCPKGWLKVVPETPPDLDETPPDFEDNSPDLEETPPDVDE
jgi:hypothetical protein